MRALTRGLRAAAVAAAAVIALVLPAAAQAGTMIDASQCAAGSSSLSFGSMLPGTNTISSSDCIVSFGSDTSTATLRMYQRDLFSSAMMRESWRWTSVIANGDGTRNSVSAASASVAFAVGGTSTVAGRIDKTSDGGTTWTAQSMPAPATRELQDVFAMSALEAWAVGESGAIISTSDGGTTWSNQSSGTTALLRSVEFATLQDGWAVGDGGKVLRTVDGGQYWANQASCSANNLYSLSAVSTTVAWVAGAGSAICRTTDGGASWTSVAAPEASVLWYSVKAIDSSTVIVVGSLGRIYRTTNAGSSWTQVASGTTQNLWSVDYAAGRWYVAGAGGTVLASDDGITFNAEPVSFANNIKAIDAFDPWSVFIATAAAGVGRRGVPINDYSVGVGTTWSNFSAGSFFGACLRAVGASTLGSWNVDSNGSCTAFDTDPWYPISTSSSAAAAVATASASGVTSAVAKIRFGLHSDAAAPAGSYAAPLVVEAFSPEPVVPPANVTAPTFTGSAVVGQVASRTSDGTWSPVASSYAYQWLRCSNTGSNCTAIPGATSSTYTLTIADVGLSVRLQVTASNGLGSSAAQSAASATITNVVSSATWMTGFEHGTVSAVGGGIADVVNMSPTADSSVKRSGAYSLSVAAASTSISKTVAASAVAAMRVAVRVSTLPSSQTTILDLVDGSSRTASILLGPTGQLSAGFTSGGSTLTTVSGPVIATGTWYVIDLQGVASLSTWQLDWRVDNLIQPSASYLIAASTFTTVRVGVGAGGGVLNYDDVMVSTTSGDYPIGDGVILSQVPSAVGTHATPGSFTQYPAATVLTSADTTTWSLVDEWPASVTDSVTQTTAGTGAYIEYRVAATAGSVAPDAVSVLMAVSNRTSTSTSPSMGYILDTTTSQLYTSTTVAGMTPTYFSKTWSRRTDGTAWTTAALNAMRLRWGYSSSVTRSPQLSSALVEADFPASATAPPTSSARPSISGSAVDMQTLTRVAGTWSSSKLVAYSYQWQRCSAVGSGCVDIPGATGTSYVLDSSDVGGTVRVVETATNGGGSAASNSLVSARVAGLSPVNTVVPMTSGSAAFGQSLSKAADGTWTATTPLTYAYQWQRSTDNGATWTDVAAATSATYTIVAGDVNAKLRLSVTATSSCWSGCGSSTAYSASTGVVAGTLPANTAAPTISGTATTGQTLSLASNGTWNATPAVSAYAYQWQRSTDNGVTWSAIVGATSSSYLLAAADVNYLVRLQVTATNTCTTGCGSTSASSVATLAISGVAPSGGTASIAGTATAGQVLSASSTWAVAGIPASSLSYTWVRCNSAGAACSTTLQSGASSTYTLVSADVDGTIKVTVTATNTCTTGCGSSAATSAASGVVTGIAPAGGAVSISGTVRSGQTLTATDTWTTTGVPAPSKTFAWVRCDGAGANCTTTLQSGASNTYTLVPADVNGTIKVTATSTNSCLSGCGSASATSAATVVVAGISPTNTAVPTFSGTATVGQVLAKSSDGTWSATPAVSTYVYQWQRSTDSGATWSAIAGATSSSYLLAAADVNYLVRLQVTASNTCTSGCGSASAVSLATSTVAGLTPSGGAASISGTITVGQVLTASSTWTVPGTPAPTMSYTWVRCDGAGANCTTTLQSGASSTYTLVAADINSTIKVTASAANTCTVGCGTGTATSAATSVVAGIVPAGGSVTISGSAVYGQTITAVDSWTTTGTPAPTKTYSFVRCNASGTGCTTTLQATSSTQYTIAAADVNNTIKVTVTATNTCTAGCGSSSATSSVTAVVAGVAPTAGTVAVSGTLAVPNVLTASTSGFTLGGPPATYSYQWRRCNYDGTGCADIAGATASTYTLAVADQGSALRVVATLANTCTSGCGSVSATSAATAEVPGQPPVNWALPVISGTAEQGYALATTNGTWSGSPTGYAYQWRRCDASGGACADIAGAIESTYMLQAGDVGGTVRVVVAATNISGTTSATSAQSAVIVSYTRTFDFTTGFEYGVISTAGPTGITNKLFNSNVTSAGDATTADATVARNGAYSLKVAKTSGAGAAYVGVTAASAVIVKRFAVRFGTALPTTVFPLDGNVAAAGTAGSIRYDPTSGKLQALMGAVVASGPAPVVDTWYTIDVRVSYGTANSRTVEWMVDGVSQPTATDTTTQAASTISEVQLGSATTGALGTVFYDDWAFSSQSADFPIGSGAVTGLLPDGTGTSSGTFVVTPTGATWQSVLDEVPMNSTTDRLAMSTASSTAFFEVTMGAPADATTATAVRGVAAISGSVTTANLRAYVYRLDGTSTCLGIAAGSCTTLVTTPTTLAYISNMVPAPASGWTQAEVASLTMRGGHATTTSPYWQAFMVEVDQPRPYVPRSVALPSTTGTYYVGQSLTASNGTWTGTPTSYAYQWRRCNSAGASCVDIASATASSYTLVPADHGMTLRMRVTASNAGGSGYADSNATPVISTYPPTNTALPAISGSALDGQVLTASTGTWANVPSSYAYQWRRCNSSGASCVDIVGATASTYTLGVSDITYTIRVVVTASNVGGSGSATSNQTAVVNGNPPSNTVLPAISGTTAEGETLSTSSGTWAGTPTISYTYQWQRCDAAGTNCAAISGATQTTYTLDAASVDTTIRVSVTATSTYGVAGAVSAATALIDPRVPVGTVLPYLGGTLPAGWLLADGSTQSGNTYSDLYNAIGTTYGIGDGTTKSFSLPNMGGRFPLGNGTFAAGAATGAMTHTHTFDAPAHSHTYSVPSHAGGTVSFPSHSHSWGGLGSGPVCGNCGNLILALKGGGTAPMTLDATTPPSASSSSEPGASSMSSDVQATTESTSDSTPPYRAQAYMIKATRVATSSPCNAIWGSASTTAPSGATLAQGTGTVTCSGTAIPDLRGRHVLGANATYAAGTTGGSNTHTLTVTVGASSGHGTFTPYPSHTHDVTTPSHTHTNSIIQISVSGGGGLERAKFSGTSYANNDAGSLLYSSSASSTSFTVPSAGGETVTSTTDNSPWLGVNFMLYGTSSYAVAPGTIVPFTGSTVPAGWLLADGTQKSRSTYAALFSAIGTTYGAGDGSTTFTLPNLANRIPIGSSATFPMAGTGGSLNHNHSVTLSSHSHAGGSVASHSHSFNIPSHTHDIPLGNWCVCYVTGTLNSYKPADDPATSNSGGSGSATISGGAATISTSSAAGGGTFASGTASNNPPSLVIRYIIKT